MNCPFCEKEMKKGVLSGDGRGKVRWNEGDERPSLIDRLSEKGCVTTAKYTISNFTIESFYCDSCKKMIIETDLHC